MCPLLDIPSPEAYLARFGWVLEFREGEGFHLERPDVPSDVAAGFPEPTMSIGDIIRCCHSNGYALEYVLDKNITPTTFLVREQNRVPNSNDDIEEMERKRIERLNKRRAARKQKRENIPAHLKARLETVRAADRKRKAKIASGEIALPVAPAIVPHAELNFYLQTDGLDVPGTYQFNFSQPLPALTQSDDAANFTQSALQQDFTDTTGNPANGLDFPVQDFIMDNLDTFFAQDNTAGELFDINNPALQVTDDEIFQLALQPGASGDMTLPEF
jgi:hypothetical protein